MLETASSQRRRSFRSLNDAFCAKILVLLVSMSNLELHNLAGDVNRKFQRVEVIELKVRWVKIANGTIKSK